MDFCGLMYDAANRTIASVNALKQRSRTVCNLTNQVTNQVTSVKAMGKPTCLKVT